MSAYVKKILPLCEDLGQTVFQIAGQADIKITEHQLLDPKLLALALLCRTLGNFRGAVRLVEQGLVVEARVLTRCCFENVFMIGGLYTQGVEFAQKIKADDVAGKEIRLKFIMDNEAILGALSEETREEMEKVQESLAAAAKGQLMKFKHASSIGPFKEIYLAYSQYSGDAAHPTFTALMRHFDIKGPEATFDVVPPAADDQLDETIHLACVALVSGAVAVNEMTGFTEAGKTLPDLNGRLVALQAEHFGEKSLGGYDTLMIKTEASGRSRS